MHYLNLNTESLNLVCSTVYWFLYFFGFAEEPDCEGCSPFARCQNGICVCVEHFTGDGYNCQRKFSWRVQMTGNCWVEVSKGYLMYETTGKKRKILWWNYRLGLFPYYNCFVKRVAYRFSFWRNYIYCKSFPTVLSGRQPSIMSYCHVFNH